MKLTRRDFIKAMGAMAGCLTVREIDTSSRITTEHEVDLTPPGVLVLKGLSQAQWAEMGPALSRAMKAAIESGWSNMPIVALPPDASIEFVAFQRLPEEQEQDG
jgi:hypothetical protein